MEAVHKRSVNLLPGSKGWIKKYLDLVQKGKVPLQPIERPADIDSQSFIHAVLVKTGINFGYPSSLLFAAHLDDSKWTVDEKLKLLLFEAHLFIYLIHHPDKPFDKELFLDKLLAFYGEQKPGSISRLFKFIVKESKTEKLESILASRIEVKLNILENSFWINYIHNLFVYLDVILFHEEFSSSDSVRVGYDELATNALSAISMASNSDGVIEAKERSMFKIFLASAKISDALRVKAEDQFERGGSLEDITIVNSTSRLSKLFLLDLSCFVIFSTHNSGNVERHFLREITRYLGFGEKELNQSLAFTEQFILNNYEKVPFLSDASSIEKLYGNLSKRWIKVLGRNKDKLATELKQSKELVYLIRKSTTTDLTREEKEIVKEQFKDIVKTMPSLAIFLLPGGAVLLPLVLKIIPDLIPSAFRDNKLEE